MQAFSACFMKFCLALNSYHFIMKNGKIRKRNNRRQWKEGKKMQQEKKTAIDAIEQKASLVCEVADHIWDYAELSLQEVRSAALYCEVLEKEGFHVEKGICGIQTAFSASYGTRPSADRNPGGVRCTFRPVPGGRESGKPKERISGGNCGQRVRPQSCSEPAHLQRHSV